MTSLTYILLSCFIISLLALVGFISILVAKRILEKLLIWLISFASGTLLGGAFFHLMPESIAQGGPTFPVVVIGIVVFFVIENLLYTFFGATGGLTYDSHAAHHRIRPVGILNLIGDGVHNMIDGVIVASSFLAGTELGLVAALAVALHELPQEVGDFAILIYSGYDRKRALVLNYLASLSIFIGAVGFFLFAEVIADLVKYALPFAAGGFIYIATVDLLAQIKQEPAEPRHRILQFLTVISGLLLLWYMRAVIGE